MNDQVYILIRTKHSFVLPKLFRKQLSYFKEALESVARQDYKHISLILLQDCWWRIRRAPRLTTLPRYCREILQCATHNIDTYFYTSNSRGAAHALYNIRELFIEQSKKHENAIAIMLDDDDLLTSSQAVSDIVGAMGGENDICISKFVICGDNKLNIINKGGGAHNKLISVNSGKTLSTSTNTPFGEGSLAFADSLGWTKSYRRAVLEEYHKDLVRYFKSQRALVSFLKRHNAFEDFPEIINLCRKGYRVIGLDKPTHTYRKHSGSITASPKKRDFTNNRPKFLSLLVGLYGQLKDAGKLSKDSNVVIARYCLIKILVIENIMAKFRSDGHIRRWLHKTRNSYFLNKFIQTTEKDGTLPTLVELCDSISGYKGYDDSVTTRIKTACENEVNKKCIDISNCSRDKSNQYLLQQRRQRYWAYAGYAAVAILTIGFSIRLLIEYCGSVEVWGVAVGIWTAVGGWIYGGWKKKQSTKQSDEQMTAMFSDAITELYRHITAGFDCLWSVKDKMVRDPHYKPAKVHFANLKVSPHSLLMSDQMDSHIIVEEFKDLPRLRVNIRNINNSANYMEEYVDSPDYSRAKMIEIIEWELARYVGYIANFMYFNEQRGFTFPTSFSNLDIYVQSQDILERIANNVKLTPGINKLQEVNRYYELYTLDKRVSKTVI